MFEGIEIRQNEYMAQTMLVQFRFPRSKRKRIQKKWRKCLANFRPEPIVWNIDGVFYCHPKVYEQVKEKFTIVMRKI